MILISQRNMVIKDKTYRPGDEIVGLSAETIERFLRDGMAIYQESPVEFSEKGVQSEDEAIAKLDPERKPSKRKE